MNTMDVIEQMSRARTDGELFCCFDKAMREFGFDRILLALINDHPRLRQSAQHGILKNYPDEWVSHYLKQGYDLIDPVRSGVAKEVLPFTWAALQQSPTLTRIQQRMFSEAREAGLHNGIGVPLYGPGGANAGIGLASSTKTVDADSRHLPLIQALSTHFYACYWRLHEKTHAITDDPLLSAREIEILRWLAAGFTKSDVGDKLNISTHTVDFHTRSILAKLDAKNIASAIYFSTCRGLIPFI